MTTFTRLPRPLALAVAAAGFAAAAAEVSAQIACGATINQGETVTLTSDLGPCDGVEGAVILESGILDLGGHTVSCADTNGDGSVPDGVVLLGRKAQARNGMVTGCDYDVYVGGSGKHTVEAVTTTAAVVYGFYVASDSGKNRLAGNTASANLDDGFQVRGPKNKVEGNVANGNGEDGIDLTQAKANRITANTTTNNVDDGIEATGTKNKIVGNTSTGNGDFGIAVGDRGNKVVGNTATGNGSADIIGQEPCKGNKFKNNTFGSGSSCVK
jgi:parallel beta-helix repeat protein